MHNYSNTQILSSTFYVLLSAVSVMSAWVFHLVLSSLKLDGMWWIEFPSVLGFYGIIWRWFDKTGWGVPLVRKLCHISTPNLNGRWATQVNTQLEEQPHTVTAEAIIKQNLVKDQDIHRLATFNVS